MSCSIGNDMRYNAVRFQPVKYIIKKNSTHAFVDSRCCSRKSNAAIHSQEELVSMEVSRRLSIRHIRLRHEAAQDKNGRRRMLEDVE